MLCCESFKYLSNFHSLACNVPSASDTLSPLLYTTKCFISHLKSSLEIYFSVKASLGKLIASVFLNILYMPLLLSLQMVLHWFIPFSLTKLGILQK